MSKSTYLRVAAMVLAAALAANTASAQLLGHNFPGDFGLTAGTQPPPGWWPGLVYINYRADTLRDGNGNSISLDPQQRSDLDVDAVAPLVWWVSEKKIWGGNYSFVIAASGAKARAEAPIFGLALDISSDLSDAYVQPINLGWHTQRADYTAGLGVYVPTGTYEPDANDNVGLGMWSYEVFGGTTLYLDKARSWNLALAAFYETHSEKEGSDVRVGDILTLEGGLGKSFAQGAINVGAAFYGQWKVSDDDFGGPLPPSVEVGRHRGFGVGPEAVLPILVKKKLRGILSLRYLWETDVRTNIEGQSFVATVVFPIGVDFGQ